MNAAAITRLANRVLKGLLNSPHIKETEDAKITITIKVKDGEGEVTTIRTYGGQKNGE